MKNDEQEVNASPKPNAWDVLKERKKKGLWDGEITTHEVKDYPITSGEHYYEITDIRKREVTCTSCPIKHGGILEAHKLTRYEVKDGIIYLDGKAMTKAPKK